MRRAVHLVLLVGFAVVESDASDSDCPGSKPTSTAQRFALEANNAASRYDLRLYIHICNAPFSGVCLIASPGVLRTIL